jgi:predicted MFS family arabinose efflux permease
MQSKIAADRFGPTQLPSAMAVLLGAFPIGIGLAQLVLPPVSAGYGLAAAFWAGAALAGVAAVGLTLAWTEPAEAVPRSMAWPSRREVGLVAIAGAIWMVYNAAWFNFMAWMPSLLAVRGHAPWVADAVLTLGTWANFPAMLLGGWLAVRWGRSFVFIAGTVICTLSVAGPAVVDAPLLWGVVFGTAAAMPGSLIVELGALSCRPENRAVGMGIFYITYNIGGAVMPAICGAAADWAGDPGGALVVAAAVALLGIPLWFWHARLRAAAV